MKECCEEAAVAKLEVIDLSETLREVLAAVQERHKGHKDSVCTGKQLSRSSVDSRPTLDCSPRTSYGDARGLLSDTCDFSLTIREEEESPQDTSVRLETDTSIVDLMQPEEMMDVTFTEPADLSSVKSGVGKKKQSRLARVKANEGSTVQKSLQRRSSTLWRLT